MDDIADNDDTSTETPRPIEPNVLTPPPPWTSLDSVFLSNSTRLLCQDDRVEAKYLLILQRRNQPDFRPPESQKRHIFRSKSRKELKSNEINWKFNKLEVARALDTLFKQNPLPRSGIAKALLHYVQPTSVDDLWCHLHGENVEKVMKRRFSRRSTDKSIPDITWLDIATRLGNVEYIELLCESSLGVVPITNAFGLALKCKLSFIGLEILLKHGAKAIEFEDQVRGYVQERDDGFVQLLLSYPEAMTITSWQQCLSPQLHSVTGDDDKDYPHILKRCLTELPGLASSDMVINALTSQNIAAVKLLLEYTSPDKDMKEIHARACELACRIQDNDRRCECFDTLFKANFLADGLTLREELMKNVKARQLSLIRILMEARVLLDVGPYDATGWAASQLDHEILLLLRDGSLSKPASCVLYSIPESAPESDIVRIIDILSPRGLDGEALSWRLTHAVVKKQSQLVTRLLDVGASVEYESASAIKSALGHDDDTILKMLIGQPCSPSILSAVIPTAMALVPRQKRRAVMVLMLNKGLPSEKLRKPLQNLVREIDSGIDYDLIETLIQHRAPVDASEDGVEEPITLATKKGDLRLLHILCKENPKVDSVSTAVPFALKLVRDRGLSLSLQVLTLLLKHGARGFPVHETLLTAAEDNELQDKAFRISSLLLENGADPNQAAGAPYATTIKHKRLGLLVKLCNACVLNKASLDTVLPLVVQPHSYNFLALSMVLQKGLDPAGSLNSAWTLASFREVVRHNAHILEIVSCSLDYGLDVDIDNGILLRFAIREVNFDVLERLLSANPSLDSLNAAFSDAILIENRNVQLTMIELLLKQAGSAEIGQPRELFTETALALDGDATGLRLLLRHRAVVDFEDGKAVLAAASAGAVDVLDLLLLSEPSELTIQKACILVARVDGLSYGQKIITLQHLLTANGGMPAESASKLLIQSIQALPEYIELPRQLLAGGAIVEYTALEVALKKGSSSLFSLLLGNTVNQNIIVRLFRAMGQGQIHIERKRWAYKCLLDRGIPVDDISEALIASLPSDTNDLYLLKLFLQYGAAVDYAHCAAIDIALRSNSRKVIKILCDNLTSDQNAVNAAFNIVTHADSPAPHIQAEAYRLLLGKTQVSQALLQTALESSLAEESGDTSVADLLLLNGADPNKDGARCFFIAINAGAENQFRALAKRAKINSLLEALMVRFAEEGKIARWFRICLEVRRENLTLEELYQNSLIFDCMRKFPRGGRLLELLLEYKIVAPDATIDHSICPDWPPESCTALLWALSSTQPRVGNDTIIALLYAHDAEDCDVRPFYQTRDTKISAAFSCLLDKERTPVLKVLLDLDRPRILKSKILGTTFGHLAAYPNVHGHEPSPDEGEITLAQASVFVGSFGAYRALNILETPNEGNLHLAAQLALPLFVQYFLRDGSDDPSRGVDRFDCLTPLAVAVMSPHPMPWCRIANQENDWKVRIKQTILLLSRDERTDLRWNNGGLTVLHYAMKSGPWMVEALIQALDIKNEAQRNDIFLYKDNDGLLYSPDEYVQRVLKEDRKQKELLLRSLSFGEFTPRFYRDVLPNSGAGQQPRGYRGLPPHLSRAWEIHEATITGVTHSS
ncbi:hypothetical protein F5Y08DRAFT_202108 [Xylaria arbuscula]|nr:hypothetical protein F5Y08DRAFT_202108 [Xylaria arbuscula]